MKFRLNWKFLMLINGVGVALTIGVMALLFEVDAIVHGSLYGYGLVFNEGWALPYWVFQRWIMGLVAGLGGLYAFSMTYIVWSQKTLLQQKAVKVSSRPTISQRPTVPQRPRVVKETQKLKPEAVKPVRGHDVDENGVEIMALPMVCSKCGKVFSQPLCMFDFKSGKPRLVNVCPYCNAVLAVSGNPNPNKK